MRMVCESTSLSDQETNFQTKLDELDNLLDEIIMMPGEKVVIFSQWERMTRLVAAMLQQKEIGFAYLHGSIPGKDREPLFKQFNQQPDCRVFLSTDAGGVGLNLQAAAYMVNLDIPWNPAILEQRIGRIYRMGQRKNVVIFNMVSQDTIEERMLEVLKFKKGIAAGILDAGDSNIFTGESKFKQFMKSVESISTDLPTEQPSAVNETEERKEKEMFEPAPLTNEPAPIVEEHTEVEKTSPASPIESKSIEEEVLEKGAGFMESLVQVLNDPQGTQRLAAKLTEKDETTGQTYLKIPVSHASVVENALKIFSGLFAGMGK